MDDAELFAIEIETLWDRDAAGRLVQAFGREGSPAPYVLIGTMTQGYVLGFGANTPAIAVQLVQAVVREWRRFAPSGDASHPPVVLKNIDQLLPKFVPGVQFESGPGYLVPEGASFASDARIVRSTDDFAVREGIIAPPEANWAEDEWRDLLAGSLGPWAMVAMDNRAIAICHSARWATRGAEAGAWTHPDHRGKGFAAAATAAWANLVYGEGRLPFYSTSAENLSSQRVAERLGMRLIGWQWSWRPEKPG